jgi:secretion/DNA translocation related CpaE-like protein
MSPQHRPLLLTADAELLDQLLGMAAAAGVAVDVAVDPGTCRPQWSDAPLVLLGGELVGATAAVGLRPRQGVLAVTRGTTTPELWSAAASVGAEDVLDLPADEAELLDRLADVTEPAVPARVIGVLAGRGGAGASVLAAGLALTAAARGPSWLIDLDPFGGGADALLGAELSAGARWTDLGLLAGRLSPSALRPAVPAIAGVAVVAADDGSTDELAPESVRAVVSAASRGGGTVILDLGRYPTGARHEAVAAADQLLLVVPAELRGVLAARRVVRSLRSPAPTTRVVVRPVPGALPGREVVHGLDLPLAGELPEEVTVRAALQVGDAAALVRGTQLGALCEALLVVPAPLRDAA